MPRAATPHLTEAEQRIISVLWERGEASVRELTDALEPVHGLAYTTVLTTVRIMTDKGYVGFRREGRAHIYRALISKSAARRRALGSVVASWFEGSPQRLAQQLIEDEALTLEDIEALRAELINRSGKEE